jgi:hypothetical protein
VWRFYFIINKQAGYRYSERTVRRTPTGELISNHSFQCRKKTLKNPTVTFQSLNHSQRRNLRCTVRYSTYRDTTLLQSSDTVQP